MDSHLLNTGRAPNLLRVVPLPGSQIVTGEGSYTWADAKARFTAAGT